MPKKIFEMATEVGIGALDLVEKLKTMGFNIRNHMSTLTDDEVEKVLATLKVKIDKKKVVTAVAKKAPGKKVAKKAVPSKTTVKTVKFQSDQQEESEPAILEGKVEEERVVEVKRNEPGSKKSVTVRRKSVIRRKAQDSSLYEKEVDYDHEDGQLPGVMRDDSSFMSEEEVEGKVKHIEEADHLETSASSGPAVQGRIEDFPELRGLQVIYRPEVLIAQAKAEASLEQVKEGTQEDQKNKKEYLDEKMHSFTPIYTPPAEKEKPSTLIDKTKKEEWNEDLSDDTLKRKDEGDRADSKKRMGGLAAMMAKPKGKIRDMIQLRADEELKTYNIGILGKAVYTPPGRKRVYSGPSKDTMITAVKKSKRVLQVYRGCTATELAQKLSLKYEELRDKSLDINLLIKPQDYLGIKLLQLIAAMYQYRVEDSSFDEGKALSGVTTTTEEEKDFFPTRSPVVTVMGHVDHGKTTLLDTIRKTKVVADEAGGITQHMGAYSVKVKDKFITFIDTPGHAAFSSMRERGTDVTDIVVLVVAADDGVMPQTRESIQLCKNAGVPIIVAVNKMDKEGVNPDRIKQALLEYQLTPEEWGGETMYIGISALKNEGVDKLLESILLQAEMMDLKSDAKGLAEGVVLESRMEAGRGAIVTVLVQTGTLNQGDPIVVGECFGRARSLLDAAGKALKKAGPSTPVQILGLNGPPNPGDKLNVVKSEREGKKVIENRINLRKELSAAPQSNKISLEDFFGTQAVEGEKKLLKLVVRTDVQGTFEAIKKAIEALGNAEVGVEIIQGGTGAITDTDVQLAHSTSGFILGFNMRPMTSAQRLAEEKGVDIKTYRIIYELIQDVKLALEGMLSPDQIEKYIGRAEVRDTFNIPKIGTIAGSAVIDGKIERGCNIRLLRDGKIVFDGKLSSLKRFKDDVKEVKTGYECGISLENFNNVQVRDIFEAYMYEEKKRTLENNANV